jgi:hypothetical protein
LHQDDEDVQALLQEQTLELGVVPIHGERIWPELGFRPEWAERGRREGWHSRVRRWWHRGSYRPPRAAARILAWSTAGSLTMSYFTDRRLKMTVFPLVVPRVGRYRIGILNWAACWAGSMGFGRKKSKSPPQVLSFGHRTPLSFKWST